jgi:hypothetical protein
MAKTSRNRTPKLFSSKEKGSIFMVHKVGFYISNFQECNQNEIEPPIVFEKSCPLPTIVIKFNKKKELCRLPLGLAKWAETCLAITHATKKSPFPNKVEMGILNDRPYAEILLIMQIVKPSAKCFLV